MSRAEGLAWFMVVVLLIIAGLYTSVTEKPVKSKGGSDSSDAGVARSAEPVTFPEWPGRRKPEGDYPGSRSAFNANVQFHPLFDGTFGLVPFKPEEPPDYRSLFNRAAKLEPVQEVFPGARSGDSAAGGGDSRRLRFLMPNFGFSGGFSGSFGSGLVGGAGGTASSGAGTQGSASGTTLVSAAIPGASPQIVTGSGGANGSAGGSGGNGSGQGRSPMPITGGASIPAPAIDLCK